MFIYNKKLQYPVKIDKPNPRLAAIIISQYGGPDGELGASLRYLSQRYSMYLELLLRHYRIQCKHYTEYLNQIVFHILSVMFLL